MAAERSGGTASGTEGPDLLKIVESVVAPATALTALMYFFGLLHAYWFLQTFGVEYTIMDFTTYDFLLRSADGLFVPLAAAAAVGLAVLWTYRPIVARIPVARRSALARAAPHVAIAVGALLLIGAVVGIIWPRSWFPVAGLPGMALALGVLFVTTAVRLYRLRTGSSDPPRSATAFWEWAAIFLLVNIGLFWAVADYSAAVGGQRGADVIAALTAWPDVVLYSERALNLSAAGVVESTCGTEDSAYRFRYDGLKLILQSGDQLLFLPERWTRESGTALVVPRSEAVRLDFAIAGVVRDGTCPT